VRDRLTKKHPDHTIDRAGKIVILIYDGSFEGLVCALRYSIEDSGGSVDAILVADQLESQLFREHRTIVTDDTETDRFLERIETVTSPNVTRALYLIYLSEEEGFETLALEYLKLAFKTGRGFEKNTAEPAVLKAEKTCSRVSLEVHRLMGLVRFRKLSDGVFYAAIEPDHNVLNLLLPHFRARFGKQKWMIHDLKRSTAVICSGRYAKVAGIELLSEKLLLPAGKGDGVFDEDESVYQGLWKEYFRTIAIEERKNPKLQKQYMPVRYWKHLVEKNG
jgi:probable DNA metabolism protein